MISPVPRLLAFKINNFKSLVDFSLRLATQSSLTCLIGLNGSGKSTILQAIDFAAQMFRGDLEGWLKYRGWSSKDISHKPRTRRNVDMSICCEIEKDLTLVWSSSFNPYSMRCTEEIFLLNTEPVLTVKEKTIRFRDSSRPIDFQYQGSVLSQLNPDRIENINSALQVFKNFVSGVRSFDLLSPHLLKQRARGGDNIGIGGEKLSAFLHALPLSLREEINKIFAQFYPNRGGVVPLNMQFGWKSLYIVENLSEERFLATEARHINDGALRILAIVAELFSPDTVLMFDEIENGVNPAIVSKLVEILVSASKQVIVTTHSPLVLNYLDDEIAIDSTVLVYRMNDGYTRSKHFFELSEAKERLQHMSPGEVFLDVDIEDALNNLSSGVGVEA